MLLCKSENQYSIDIQRLGLSKAIASLDSQVESSWFAFNRSGLAVGIYGDISHVGFCDFQVNALHAESLREYFDFDGDRRITYAGYRTETAQYVAYLDRLFENKFIDGHCCNAAGHVTRR